MFPTMTLITRCPKNIGILRDELKIVLNSQVYQNKGCTSNRLYKM